MTSIDDLLANARVPTTSGDAFDVGAALRRLARDAAEAIPPRDMLRSARAGEHLSVICRWYLNRPDAADHVDRLAQDPDTDTPADVREEQLDVDGALVFACLLHLTEHPESAQFWWQLAAGAGHRAAAYCLHLHHLARGETREAQHWIHQVTDTLLDTPAPDKDFLVSLEKMTRFVRVTGCTRASPPTGGLEMEVVRLAASGTGSCIILRRPDRGLAAQLHRFNAPDNSYG
ncbi:hypothetical protein [Streptomyces iconiensis]|uniref:Uncharacterized protein n=1 Tax=Streptomyces iconiensis TaxID=1384038 RepID=A0ABT7A724_9ACTN|nr:hypothetical protein [Streptomyces iconiensis]MDJ1137125.1 hypothetical protein [Streptomyces iconiensis]